MRAFCSHFGSWASLECDIAVAIVQLASSLSIRDMSKKRLIECGCQCRRPERMFPFPCDDDDVDWQQCECKECGPLGQCTVRLAPIYVLFCGLVCEFCKQFEEDAKTVSSKAKKKGRLDEHESESGSHHKHKAKVTPVTANPQMCAQK